jgi:transposase
MAGPKRKTYRPWNPEEFAVQSYTPAQKLPENDLVFFLLDVIPQLDLSRFYASYEVETRGAPPFDPGMMATLLVYSYSVGVFSSRKIATACERNLAFLAIVGPKRPDFRTISDFRKEHLGILPDFFNQVLRLAHEAGLVQLGLWATDGSKIPGNASRHKAMSYGYMNKEEKRLKAEIAELLKRAEQTDEAEDAALGSSRGDELPAELAFREQRLARIQEAKARLEEQARAAAEAERQRRAEADEEVRQGSRHAGGRPAQPISEVPDDKAQTSFTDPELKIMKQANKSFEYSGNAQVVVDDVCQIIVAWDVVTDSNDKQQAVPMAQRALDNLEAAGIARPKDEQGQEQKIAAVLDTGYFSEKAVSGLEGLGFEPFIATERQKHHAPSAAVAAAVAAVAVVTAVAAGSAEAEQPAEAEQSGEMPQQTAEQKRPAEKKVSAATEQMRAKLRTERGRAVYGLRKGVVEPVFGQIKGARGFRRFSLRGLEKVRGEWCLVCLTHNLLKIWRYRSAPSRN